MNPDLTKYPLMKDSGVPWLGEVPDHWEVLPNRAMFAEVRERDRPNADMLSVTISKGVIRQRALLGSTSKKDSSNEDKSAYKLVQPGDIVYNKMRAWQGAVGTSEHEGIVSPAYVVQRPRKDISSRYLHYLLRTPAFAKEAERWSYGITSDMWSLRPEHFKMIRSCLPPRPEQASITRFLDFVDRRVRLYIRAQLKLIRLLEEQKQATIHYAVTRGLHPNVRLQPSGVEWLGDVPENWEVLRLRNAVELRVSSVDKHTRDDEVPVRLCNYVDVYRNDRISSNMPFMRASATEDEIERFRLRSQDVLITKDSEDWTDIAVPALVTEADADLISGYHLALLRPHEGRIIGGYLFYALQSPSVARQLHVAATGVTRYGLSHEAIRSCWLPLPTLPEQTEIVEFLDEETKMGSLVADRAMRQIHLLREYHTRLVADVVTGKLDVRDAAARLPDETDVPELLGELKDDGDTEDLGAGDLDHVTDGVEA